MKIALLNLESDAWSVVTGPTINPISPIAQSVITTSDELRLYTIGEAYAGWLAKHVAPLLTPSALITFSYLINPDSSATFNAQALETDTRLTDASGWTYNGSCQLNLAEGGMWQVPNPTTGEWFDIGVRTGPLPANTWTPVTITYSLDYSARLISIVNIQVSGTTHPIPVPQKLPAKLLGWTASQVVTQLQPCLNSRGGAFSVGFKGIQYQF
jgi:hypothetical protein